MSTTTAKGGTSPVSLRLPSDMVKWINLESKSKGVTKTDVISSILANRIQGNTPEIMERGGEIKTDVTPEDMNLLVSLGIGSAAGIAGYKISKYIRQRYEKEPNEGMDMLIGLMTGVLSMAATLKKD